MKRFKGFAAGACLALTVALSACSPSKDIVYFQDLVPGSETFVTLNAPVKLEKGDKIRIQVSTPDDRLNDLLNLQSNQQGGSNQMQNSFTVDSQGDILYPTLGKIPAAGMTREQLAEYIRREIITRDLAKDPIVTIEFMDMYVTVMGEVSSAGRQEIDRDSYTIIDALGAAGDLSILGKRHNIKVIRTENGVQRVYTVDMTNGQSLAASPVYYLKQNDIVYVEPNGMKVRQSQPNGSIWSTPGFWMGMFSFAVSVVAICTK